MTSRSKNNHLFDYVINTYSLTEMVAGSGYRLENVQGLNALLFSSPNGDFRGLRNAVSYYNKANSARIIVTKNAITNQAVVWQPPTDKP